MDKTIRPKIVCSKCLGFASCRYNGACIPAPYVQKLTEFCDITTVCPEVEIGLGVPRKPIRIVKDNSQLQLFQPETGTDYTTKMSDFCSSYLENINEVHGFILKHKSPSCGIMATKYFSRPDRNDPAGRGPGFFGKAIIDRYDGFPVENEKRLTNFAIREHFLLKLFTLARFYEIKKNIQAEQLVNFQAQNKLLLLAYSQNAKNEMGKLVAHQKETGMEKTLDIYEKWLLKAFETNANHNAHINVIQHAAGYFSDRISKDERGYIGELTEKYKNKKIPLSALRAVVGSYIIRFDIDYLKEQSYFDPYPEELTQVTDSGKGRDLKHI